MHRIVLLGLGDSGMEGTPPAGSLAAAPTGEVADRVATVVADVQPDVVVTLDPEGGDGHRDHIAIGQATVEACRAFPTVRVYAWTVRRSVLAMWFAQLENVRPESAHLDLDRQGLGRPDEDITTILDLRSVRAVRERAMTEHASQTAPFDGMPADLLDTFLDTDSLIRLQPAWTGGEIERGLFGAEVSDRSARAPRGRDGPRRHRTGRAGPPDRRRGRFRQLRMPAAPAGRDPRRAVGPSVDGRSSPREEHVVRDLGRRARTPAGAGPGHPLGYVGQDRDRRRSRERGRRRRLLGARPGAG